MYQIQSELYQIQIALYQIQSALQQCKLNIGYFPRILCVPQIQTQCTICCNKCMYTSVCLITLGFTIYSQLHILTRFQTAAKHKHTRKLCRMQLE